MFKKISFSFAFLLLTSCATIVNDAEVPVTLSFSDTEGDAVNLNTFTLQTGSHTPFSFHTSASKVLVQPNANLTAGTYEVTGSIKDAHGFRANTEDVEIDVVQGASKIFAFSFPLCLTFNQCCKQGKHGIACTQWRCRGSIISW